MLSSGSATHARPSYYGMSAGAISPTSITSSAPSDLSGRHLVDRWFYPGIATLMLITAIAGFAPAAFSPAGRREPISVLAGIHGAVFFIWSLMFLTQSLLIKSKRLQWHQRLGVASAFLLALMVPLGYQTTIGMVRRGYDLSGDQYVGFSPTTRCFRQGVLLARNDIYSGNLVYQAIEGTRMGIRYLMHKDEPQTTATSRLDLMPLDTEAEERSLGTPVSSDRDLGSTPIPANGSPPHLTSETGPLFELGVRGGWLGFGSNLSSTTIFLEPKNLANQPASLLFANRVQSGWSAGTSVTLNSWRWFSNELSFDYQRGRYRLGAELIGLSDLAPTGYQEGGTGIAVNQFGYALVANLGRRESRFRPYVAVGPAFQLLHITDAPVKKPGTIFRAGLRNVGLILAAYNFGNEPPLDGGGVFQFGFQYGGGLKYRMTRRLHAERRLSGNAAPAA